ncbi:MAG: carbohydrate-binding family 9-like protein [Phycisphaerales bacterium]|nr:carbohydrate-binding family 9-like protein [Phycisphaerales bacterium]
MAISARHRLPLLFATATPIGMLCFSEAPQIAPPTAPAVPVESPNDTPPAGTATARTPTFAPRLYECARASNAPKLDGKLDDAVWASAPWTDNFLDIEGPALAAPRFQTRAKMLWDDSYFYIAAELREPHLWATLRKHDEIVFHDNDFEVFIDPDGDTREYYEIEVNALGTIFDLYLHRRYKEGGPAEHAWNAEGLRTAIHLDGTLNDATDIDRAWTLEWAIPWSAFKPPALNLPSFTEGARAAAAPKAGEEWRVNFSRVQWTTTLEGKSLPKIPAPPINDSYTLEPPKETAPAFPYSKITGKPEDNWVWSPQWQIDMHDPRFWGRVRFTAR